MNHSTPRPASPVAPIKRTIPWVDLWVGCATPPVILAAIGSQVMARAIAQMGRLGEDLLRGERLPLLHFPPDSPTDS
jgi:hypothetical protein